MRFGTPIALTVVALCAWGASLRARNPSPHTPFPRERTSAYAPVLPEANVFSLSERATSVLIADNAFEAQHVWTESTRDHGQKGDARFSIHPMPFGQHDALLSLNDNPDDGANVEATKRSIVVSSRSEIAFTLGRETWDRVRASVALLNTTSPTRVRIRYGETICEKTIETPLRWHSVTCDAPHPRSAPTSVHLEADGNAGLVAWGNVEGVIQERARLPYNVLWFVVDSLRADAISTFHIPGSKGTFDHAAYPPLEAALQEMPGLLPAIEALSHEGVRFRRAYSAGTWTKPGTVAMLSGKLSSVAGVAPLPWNVDPKEAATLYESRDRFLPSLLARSGATTHAIAANPYLVGTHAPGMDFGFATVSDARKKEHGTGRVERDAIRFLSEHKAERFFAFVNFSGPHEPWQPAREDLERVPVPPEGPSDPLVRSYLAEAVRDDRSIGHILEALAHEGLANRTLVILTSDHGETFSSEHQGTSALDPIAMRYHHQTGAFEETTHVPLVMRLPDVLPSDHAADFPVSTIDIVPTVLALLGVPDAPSEVRGGSSLLPHLFAAAPKSRPIVSEGRGMRAILDGHMRLIVRYGGAREVTLAGGKHVHIEHQLFDLASDPGERHDLASERPEEVARLVSLLNEAGSGAPQLQDEASRGQSVDPELIKMLREWGYVR